MKQRCYCLTRHFAPLERRDEEVPQVTAGEILVRISAAGVCHSDIHIWEGHYDLGSDKKITLKDRGIALPLTLGHEIAGEVVAMGPSAQGTAVGKNRARLVCFKTAVTPSTSLCPKASTVLTLRGSTQPRPHHLPARVSPHIARSRNLAL
jgi:alcohol dehydrogenase, propanol-preferring